MTAQNDYDIIIIGAGPAGLFASINCDKTSRVMILEKKETPGKKLLMSGSGKCNITNSGNIRDFFRHYGDNGRFLQAALMEFTNSDLIDFFAKRGLKVITDDNGKVFPVSENADDVLEVLLHECNKKKILISTDSEVIKIEKIDSQFHIHSKRKEYICRKLIIATGGQSYSSTGSTGDGYTFAKQLGHSIIPPKPALTPVYIKDYKLSTISGVSLQYIEINLYRNNKKIKSHRGDILFTHSGLSGPGILDFSRYIEPGDLLKINLINKSQENFISSFIEAVSEDRKLSLKKFLKHYIIPESLIKSVLSELQLTGTEQIGNIPKEFRNRIADIFCGYPFEVNKPGEYNIAMVTKGGVSLKEVSAKTMESRLVENLYFAGEVLDIDGDTGGYNLQAAFSTGYIAGMNSKIN